MLNIHNREILRERAAPRLLQGTDTKSGRSPSLDARSTGYKKCRDIGYTDNTAPAEGEPHRIKPIFFYNTRDSPAYIEAMKSMVNHSFQFKPLAIHRA